MRLLGDDLEELLAPFCDNKLEKYIHDTSELLDRSNGDNVVRQMHIEWESALIDDADTGLM